jgi:prepilin-type N-terminal cleavage/methylation domain-containing protein
MREQGTAALEEPPLHRCGVYLGAIRRSSSGVTLAELMVVMVILAILAGLTLQAASVLQSALRAGRTKGAADEIVTAIRHTRQRAITDAQDYCIALRTPGGEGQYEIHTGARSGTSCSGTSVEGPVTLSGGATVDTAALRFTPVSTVDPIGPTDIVVTTTSEGTSCSVTVTVTPEGGVQIPGTAC